MLKILFDVDEVDAGGLIFGLAEESFAECIVRGSGDDIAVTLTFTGVLGYRKCIWKDASFSEYENKLFELPQSDWLDFIQRRAAIANVLEKAEGIRHFVVNKADGPSYEVICRRVQIVVEDPLDRCNKGTLWHLEF